jgi:hypothetical protein
MAHRRILRGSELRRHRETAFSLGQSLNEMVIPRYDALADPFLRSFFDPPAQKRHLKVTGVLPKKKCFSLAKVKERISNTPTPSPAKKRAKSQAHVSCSLPK